MDGFGIATVERAGSEMVVVHSDRQVWPVDAACGGDGERPSSVRQMLPDWNEWIDRIASAWAPDTPGAIEVDDVRFLPPIPRWSTVYAAGANYSDHLLEMRPDADLSRLAPYHFVVPATSMIGDGETVRRPLGCAMLDWEIELAVVIGQQVSEVPVEAALNYVAGFTVANDLSIRDDHLLRHDTFGIDWLSSKGRTGMLPIGPALIPARFVDDPMCLRLVLSVNGSVMQDSSTAKMIIGIQEQISHLSHLMMLMPGDVIITGTPAGTGVQHGRYLQDDDVVSASIEGIGTLTTTVIGVDSPHLTVPSERG